ncbi:MAG TPA: hypothetical protein VL463_03135 [Kofleriaceae bacterium]|nr:hypothetical protein [Kofleriaceae bacterium]
MRAALALVALGACMHEPRPDTFCGDPTSYRIESVELPVHSGDGVRLGMDLDGDGHVDNAYASAIQALAAANPELGSIDAKANARLAADVAWYVTTRSCDDGTRRVDLISTGADDLAPLTVLVDQVGNYTPVTWGRIEIGGDRLVVDGDRIDGVVAFRIPVPESADALCAPIASYLTTELAAGTSPQAAKMDTDHDGVVTVKEVEDSELGRTLLLPDVIGAVSAGIAIHARRAF